MLLCFAPSFKINKVEQIYTPLNQIFNRIERQERREKRAFIGKKWYNIGKVKNMTEGIPNSPEGVSSPEKAKSTETKSFKEVQSRLGHLWGKKRDGNLEAAEVEEMNLLKERENQLIEKARAEGKFEDLDMAISILEELAQHGDLKPEQLNERERDFQEGRLSEETGELAGLREYYYLKRLEDVAIRYSTKIFGEPEKPNTEEESKSRKFDLKAYLAELESKANDLSLPQDERKEALHELTERVIVEMYKSNARLEKKDIDDEGEDIDPEEKALKDAAREKTPDIRKVGVESFLKYFDERLYDLIEKQKNRSFEEDRHLVYPLEMAIRSLWPKSKDKRDIDEKTGQEIDYGKIRQELTDKLTAFRSCHNGIYIYQNVDQASSLIKVAQFFKENVEEELSKYDEIGKAYRKILSILEDNSRDKKERQEEISRLIDEKGADGEVPLWAFRMASGLVCIQNEAARADFQFHQSGDFFQNRLFNMGDRVAITWGKLGRDPNPEFCQSLDLRLKTLWQKRIGGKLEKLVEEKIGEDDEIKRLKEQIAQETDETEKKKLEMKKTDKEKKDRKEKEQEILDYLKNTFRGLGIEISGLSFVDKEKGNSIAFKKYSLKNIDIKRIMAGDFFELKKNPDDIRQQCLDLADADAVRKAIFDPTGFLDTLSFPSLKGIIKVMKHLKDKERSSWFSGVAKETAKIFLGEKDYIRGIVHNEAEKFMLDPMHLDEDSIVAIVKSFNPFINNEDVAKTIKEIIGKTTSQIEAEKLIKAIWGLILEAILETAKLAVASEGVKIGGSSKK